MLLNMTPSQLKHRAAHERSGVFSYFRACSAADTAVPGLADCRQVSADSRRMAGFDQRRRTQVDIADMGEHADGGHQSRANQADRYNLEVGPAVCTIHGVIHGSLPSFQLLSP